MINIELDGFQYQTADVVEALSAQVTPERLQKIKTIINKRTNHLVPVLENIYDRGNTSAVMRSAEAFGFHNFHQIIEIDTFKESKRVTKGADKWLVQKNWEKTEYCISHLKSQGYKIAVTHLDGAKPINQVSFKEPVALCFGSELRGASSRLESLADERVFVPMQGFVQSFNISVAAALCFQYASLQHQQMTTPPVPDVERQWLLALYLYRSCKTPLLMNLDSTPTN